jgi:hypothetical protein
LRASAFKRPDLIFNNKYFNCIREIIKIIDIGFNFVPCEHLSNANIFLNIIKNFDVSLNRFNQSLFFKKQKDKTINVVNINRTEQLSFKSDIDICKDFSCIFKKLKDKSSLRIPLLNESLEFRFQFFYEISKHKIEHTVNLNKNQLKALRYFIKHKPFRVLEADKNIGAVIMSETLEIELASKVLNDTKTYLKLDSNPLNETINYIDICLNNLVSSFDISERCKRYLGVSNPRLGKFRILPKLIKEVLSSRPIINCINSPTSKICLFVFLILHPFIIRTETYLQDSQHLLQLLEKIDFKKYKSIYLYSCDFESLYTNINKELAIDLVSDFVKENKILDSSHLSLSGFSHLLTLIFDFNVFSFKNSFFKQVRGLAMGAICGPAIANTVVYKLEKKWLHIHKPILYSRFIDDICMVNDKLLNLSEFKENFGELKLNIKCGEKINFLDLTIFFDSIFSKIRTSLFIKPTNTFSYLPKNSNHKPSIFKNIPVSLFIRIRRICSEPHDYFYFSRLLACQLVQRGYSLNYLFSIIRNIFKIDRVSLLPYKVKEKINQKNFFIIPYNNYNVSINNLIQKSFLRTKEIFKIDNFEINVVNKVNNNLRKILVHEGKLSSISLNYNCSACDLNGCKSCSFFERKNFISFNQNFSLPILSNCNCKSKFCIYILHCKYCNCYYIGETKQTFEERFKHHISDIKCFIPYLKEKSEVAFHFNRKGHIVKEHLKAFIFTCDIINDEYRKMIESELIHIFLIMGCKVINSRLIKYVDNFFTCLI